MSKLRKAFVLNVFVVDVVRISSGRRGHQTPALCHDDTEWEMECGVKPSNHSQSTLSTNVTLCVQLTVTCSTGRLCAVTIRHGSVVSARFTTIRRSAVKLRPRPPPLVMSCC
ncbi:hypothetical protein J6590_046518 [Homalodisca vitripennis]|nr:hypothetical protein J6590_046518 [Homalodisca vitripennis]